MLGIDPVVFHAALAFSIHLFAFPLQFTFLYEATYQVQLPQTHEYGDLQTRLYCPDVFTYSL